MAAQIKIQIYGSNSSAFLPFCKLLWLLESNILFNKHKTFDTKLNMFQYLEGSPLDGNHGPCLLIFTESQVLCSSMTLKSSDIQEMRLVHCFLCYIPDYSSHGLHCILHFILERSLQLQNVHTCLCVCVQAVHACVHAEWMATTLTAGRDSCVYDWDSACDSKVIFFFGLSTLWVWVKARQM